MSESDQNATPLPHGIESPADAILRLPLRYRDLSAILPAVRDAARTGTPGCFSVTLRQMKVFDRKGNPCSFEWRDRPFRVAIDVDDAAGEPVRLTVFGAVWDWRKLKPGQTFFVAGVPGFWKEHLQIDGPEYLDDSLVGCVVPVYRKPHPQVTSDTLRKFVWEIMRPEHMAAARQLLESRCDLPIGDAAALGGVYRDIDGLLANIHRPLSVAEAESAIGDLRRILAAIAVLQARRVRARPQVAGAALIDMDVDTALQALPFTPTADQRTAIDQIAFDLALDRPMRRVLTGDVGTGKTAVFLTPAVAAVRAGKRVAVMVENLLVARQIADEAAAWFPDVAIERVTGASKPKKGQPVTAPPGGFLAIGTSALLQWSVQRQVVFDLVVIDEQQKLDRLRREALLDDHTHLLEISATPIPRSVGLITLGGWDRSELKTCPVAKTIVSRVVKADDRDRLITFLRRTVAAGHQIAIVYPVVDSAKETRTLVQANAFWESIFPGDVQMLSGGMSKEDKLAGLDRMRSMERHVLLATTVIEIGITLPSLRAMVAVNADRHGRSMLHQLRGRLARHGGKGDFFMYCPEGIATPSAEQRLTEVATTLDGFALAEMDANDRGLGDLDMDGAAQSGFSRGLVEGVILRPTDLEAIAGAAQGAGSA